MQEKLTPAEGVAILCLLTVGADSKIKHEELTSMLENPFFQEHVADKIGPHHAFIKKYKKALALEGAEKLEARAIFALNSSFTALKLKTLALMLIIAEADGEYDINEKALIGRASTGMKLNVEDAQHELHKMKKAILAEKRQTKNGN